ncbi:hypothetical protein BBJ29_002535 [Phytophthora kernoviae]|uniref:PH domain-containing protein n=1 Tax=Phytophthora kernoviae TaxID=325452 RepID=A0A3F2RSG6_9STRA|nr:hypothetical protein BBJ29_002535 [Phytophthora kernoviae]RLN62344.1 hypothetical protein BBP00_00004821 [Phytophthora kernoviae]
MEDIEGVPPEEVPRANDAVVVASEAQGCVGWLKKEGGNIKSWKRRYFTLYGTKLSYYKSEKGSLLRSCNITTITTHPSISLGLAVSIVGGRTLIMQASSQEEYEKWLAAIQEAVAGENDRKSSAMETPKVTKFVENGPITDKATVLTRYSGWLEKEGQRFKTWKKRYFTLKSSALIYYSEIGGVARGHGMVCSAHLDESKPLTIVIEFRSGKTMRVTAPNEAEENSWLQVLSKGRSSSSRTTDTSDDVVDSEEEGEDEEDEEDAHRLKRLDSNDYFANDTITNDTFMRLQDQDGKTTTFMQSTNGSVNDTINGVQYSFKGELKFDEEDEEKEDLGVSTTGADYYRELLAEDERVQAQRKSEQPSRKEEPPIAGYKARRTFLGVEFEVRLFEMDDAGIVAVTFQISGDKGAPLKFSRVFSRAELEKAGIAKTLEGHVTLVDSLELVEDAYFTGSDAVNAGLNSLAAYQLSSTLGGMSYPAPVVSQEAALAYFARAPVGLTFVAEEVDRIILASIESCLKDEVYDEQKVSQWIDFICESIMKGLGELRKPLKYIGAHVVKWPGDKHKDHNRSMYCVTTVSGLSF